MAHYQQALEIQPDYAEAHFNLGNVLIARGQLDEAIAHYRKAVGIKPDYADAYNNLGIALANRGQLDEAMAHYQQALEIEPTSPHAHYGNLVTRVGSGGQGDEAIAQFIGRGLLEIRPNYPREPINNLGLCLWLSLGRFDEAMAHYRKVPGRSAPTSPRPTTTWARLPASAIRATRRRMAPRGQSSMPQRADQLKWRRAAGRPKHAGRCLRRSGAFSPKPWRRPSAKALELAIDKTTTLWWRFYGLGSAFVRSRKALSSNAPGSHTPSSKTLTHFALCGARFASMAQGAWSTDYRVGSR